VEGGPCFLAVVENLGGGGYLAETPQSSQANLLITPKVFDILGVRKKPFEGLRSLENL
jgi:hypothetical protein